MRRKNGRLKKGGMHINCPCKQILKIALSALSEKWKYEFHADAVQRTWSLLTSLFSQTFTVQLSLMAQVKMTLEVADEGAEKEVDVIGLGCSKESFTEHEEVEKLIDELKASAQHQTNPTDIRLVERNWQRFSFILDQYQEQPHLIDSHLDGLLTKIIDIIREEGLDLEVKHVAFRCLYFISKVRGYKVVARHLPHEVLLSIIGFCFVYFVS